jgi:hypothetical protein
VGALFSGWTQPVVPDVKIRTTLIILRNVARLPPLGYGL